VTDPAETPEQAIARLNREIAQFRRLRADLPRIILKPYADEALDHIREQAALAAIPPQIPKLPPGVPGAGQIVTVTPEEADLEACRACIPSKVGSPNWPMCKRFDINGDGIIDIQDMAAYSLGVVAVTIASTPVGASSPVEYEVTVLTSDGRILTVPSSRLRAGGSQTPSPALSAAPLSLGPGVHVRVKDTGQTGYIVELADDKAQVALDQGGFITRALTDLEPV